MTTQEKILKGRNPSISKKADFPETYIVDFTWGAAYQRGDGGRPRQVPPMPEATVEIRDGEPVISWQIVPSADVESREDFEAVILQLVAEERKVAV